MNENKHASYELAQMQSLPLEYKIIMSAQRIKQWYENYDGKVYVSFSGGKDSTVLLDIVRNICGYKDVEAVYIDTGLEYPEVKRHVKTFDNVTILRPKKTFREVILEYGYPVVSKEQSQYIYEYRNSNSEKLKNIRLNGNKYGQGKISKKWLFLTEADFKISDKCCRVMKKAPARSYERKTGKKAIIGTLAEESALRRSAWIKHGCNAFESKRPTSQPLPFWTEQDILQYIKDKNLKIPSVYGDIVQDGDHLKTTKCDRTGCVYCCYGCHLESDEDNRFLRLKETHNKLYDYCMKPVEDGV